MSALALLMSLQAAAAGVAIASPAPAVSDPQPELHRGDMSYPSEAFRLRQEGKVVMRISVDDEGNPTDCAIVTSSGAQSLDQASCAIMYRTHFKPARDAAGKAVVGLKQMFMNWRLPG